MRDLRVASWSWRCHGNAEDTALGPCAAVGREQSGRDGSRCQRCSCLSRRGRARSLAQPWLCMEMKPQSLSPCRADAFLALWRLILTLNTKVFSLQP